MARVSDLLYRFRPAGAPGAAGPAGVPADRGADLAAELEPLFGYLAATESECDDIVEQAHRDAAQTRAGYAERAAGTVAAAREKAAAERTAAAAKVRRRAESDDSAALAAAEQEATELRRRATGRLPARVAEAVAAVGRLTDDQVHAGVQPVGAA